MTQEPVTDTGPETAPVADDAATPSVGTGAHDPNASTAHALRRLSAAGALGISLAIAAMIVALDQLTKHWALTSLTGKPPQHVLWTLQFNLSFNSGMAFSKGQGIGPIIGAVAIVVVIGLALSVRKVDSRIATAAAGLVVGGAAGNLADRLFRGRGWLHGSVVDFIDFQWFPIFNIADSAITIGGVLFVLWSLLSSRARTVAP
jgi:signal peptidase II